MILYFLDRSGNAIGSASTSLRYGYHIIDDVKKENVDVGVPTFEATIAFDNDTRLELRDLCKPGNYILRYNDEEIEDTVGYTISGVSDFFTIIESEENATNREINIYSEGGGLDLINDIAGPLSSNVAKLPSYYIEQTLSQSGSMLRLRNCYIPSTGLALGWDSSETVTSRLQSIMSAFECEMSFGFTITGLTVTDRWIDVKKEIGEDIGETIFINKEVNNITIKNSISNLATALYPTGSAGENTITLLNYPGGYDDGDIFIDGYYLKSRKAFGEWSRFGNDRGYIFKSQSFDASNQSDLLTKSIEYLKKVREPEVNYDVDVSEYFESAKLGDRINIVDDGGEIYISGRVLSLETSVCNRTKKATIGEYLIKTAGLSEKIKQLAEDFKELEETRQLYLWIAYASSDHPSLSDISLDPTGMTYIGTLPNQIVELTDISQITASKLSLFKWSITGSAGTDAINVRLIPTGNVFRNGSGDPITIQVQVSVGNDLYTTLAGVKSRLGDNYNISWYRNGTEILSPMSYESFSNDKFILTVSYSSLLGSLINYRVDLDDGNV